MIRTAHRGDYDALGAVMFTAIRTGPSPYTDAQRRVWNRAPQSGADWHAKLTAQFVVLGLVNDAPAGFMTLRPDGYLDLAYIIPSARGTGLFRSLYAAVEGQAYAMGLTHISVHASLTAQPAFAAMGFDVVQHEEAVRDGETLARAKMKKRL